MLRLGQELRSSKKKSGRVFTVRTKKDEKKVINHYWKRTEEYYIVCFQGNINVMRLNCLEEWGSTCRTKT